MSTGGSLTLSRDRIDRDVDKVAQQVGVERRTAADQETHRFVYPARFEVRVGGRWSRLDTAAWREGHEPARRLVHSEGTVEIEVPLRGGLETRPGSGAEPDHAGAAGRWHDGPLPAERDRSLGELPRDFELEALKPVPGLRAAMAQLVGVPRKGGWVRALAVPFTGERPARFDEHRGRHIADRQPGQLDERNAALDALEEFAGPVARAGRFERSVVFQDTLRLKAHGSPGLLGSQEHTARVDLSTRLGAPRIIAEDDAHTFRGTGQAESSRENLAETSAEYKARFSVFRTEPVRGVFSTGADLGLGVGKAHTDGILVTGRGPVRAEREHTERAYLVSFDATYQLRAVVRRNFGDVVGFWREHDSFRGERWVEVPDAARVWVPAHEIHRVGVLSDDELAKLDPADAERYRRDAAEMDVAEVDARRSVDVGRLSPIPEGSERGDSARGRTEPAQQPAAEDDHPPVAAPADIGRGVGKVELYRLAAGVELVRQIEDRLRHWTEHRGGALSSSRLELALKTLAGRHGRLLPRHPFEPVNERLVHDVLGPALAGTVADAAIEDMLTGGRTIFVEGATPFGKVEQAVVLRAELGEGRYHRTIDEAAETMSLESEHVAGTSDLSRWRWDAGLRLLGNISKKGKPGSLLAGGPGLTHRAGTKTEVNLVRRESVKAERSAPVAQFVHDLHVTMDVYPYARPGHYAKVLPRWLPKPGPRPVDEVWTTHFSLAGAVRSTVPVEDAIAPHPEAERILDSVDGSFADWRQREERDGLPEQAVLVVRPFAAPELRHAMDTVISGGDGRPGLRPRAAHQVRATGSTTALRTNLPVLLSEHGYVIKVSGDAVSTVRIKLDLVGRQLLRVLDKPIEQELRTDREVKITADRRGEVSVAIAADVRAVTVDHVRSRPTVPLVDATVPILPWSVKDAATIASTDRKPGEDNGDRRYLVRVRPVWELTPAYRSKRAPAEWSHPVRTAPDKPILIEVDRASLEALGLHDPEPDSPVATDGGPRRPRTARPNTDSAFSAFVPRRTRSRLRSNGGWDSFGAGHGLLPRLPQPRTHVTRPGAAGHPTGSGPAAGAGRQRGDPRVRAHGRADAPAGSAREDHRREFPGRPGAALRPPVGQGVRARRRDHALLRRGRPAGVRARLGPWRSPCPRAVAGRAVLRQHPRGAGVGGGAVAGRRTGARDGRDARPTGRRLGAVPRRRRRRRRARDRTAGLLRRGRRPSGRGGVRVPADPGVGVRPQAAGRGRDRDRGHVAGPELRPRQQGDPVDPQCAFRRAAGAAPAVADRRP
ncbi:LigA protein [Kutzneria sp. 744]|nr:LigA protein [Kutzneria sp. 744]